MGAVGEPRYRCDGCGNLTRFDVTTSRTTRAFHHYTVGGALAVEDVVVLAHRVDEVVCRWCGHGRRVVAVGDDQGGVEDAGGDVSLAAEEAESPTTPGVGPS